MSERRTYDRRTCAVVQDLNDQPAGKFVAFIEGLGERSAIAFDQLIFNGPYVVFMRTVKAVALAEKDKDEMVAACSGEANWSAIARAELIEMTGTEWDDAKLADARIKEAWVKKNFGEKGMTRVIVAPDGEQIAVPARPGDDVMYEKAVAAQAGKPYDDSRLYA